MEARTIDRAVQAAVERIPLQAQLQAGRRPDVVNANGFWTEDGDGNPQFEAYWLCGDIIASAPN